LQPKQHVPLTAVQPEGVNFPADQITVRSDQPGEKGRDLIDDLRCSMDEIEAVLLYGFDELGVNRLKASLENVISNQERHASNQ